MIDHELVRSQTRLGRGTFPISLLNDPRRAVRCNAHRGHGGPGESRAQSAIVDPVTRRARWPIALDAQAPVPITSGSPTMATTTNTHGNVAG